MAGEKNKRRVGAPEPRLLPGLEGQSSGAVAALASRLEWRVNKESGDRVARGFCFPQMGFLVFSRPLIRCLAIDNCDKLIV